MKTMKNRFLRTLNILLVEDEIKLSKLLKNAIGDEFYKFSIANDGEEGLKLFKQLLPDIVITDIMMPKKTGLEMAQEIKIIDKNIPIIILSAFSETDKLLNAIDVGIVKYFIKPFDPDELLEYIKSLENSFNQRTIVFKDNFKYNRTKKALYKQYKYIKLSKREKDFLELLIYEYENNNYVVDSTTIKKEIWGEVVSDDRLRTFIRRFREKTSKELVENIKGEGYKITIQIS